MVQDCARAGSIPPLMVEPSVGAGTLIILNYGAILIFLRALINANLPVSKLCNFNSLNYFTQTKRLEAGEEVQSKTFSTSTRPSLRGMAGVPNSSRSYCRLSGLLRRNRTVPITRSEQRLPSMHKVTLTS
jgi:hypothetical protein